MADLKPITIADMDSMSEALLTLVSKYTELPKTITENDIYWQFLDDKECIGIFAMQGGVYLRKYLDGSYRAQFPFRIIYNCSPSSNISRINKQKFVDELGKWLETCKATFSDTNVDIESIERTSPVYVLGANESGYVQYVQTLNIKYSHRKEV